CRAWPWMRGLIRASAARSHDESKPSGAARLVATHRLQACGPVQPRRFRRRFRGSVADGAMAIWAIQPLGFDSEPVLLLRGNPERILLPRCSSAGAPLWPYLHAGILS